MTFALPTHRAANDAIFSESTTSIATSPVAASVIASCNGNLFQLYAAAAGTTTGTIAVAVSVNGGSDVTGGGLTIPAGTGARPGSNFVLPQVETANGATAVLINEGDVITFTPSGGTGGSIPGAFAAIIKEI